jgi:large repetitive protein
MRARSVIGVAVVAVLVAGISAAVPARVAAASGSTLFVQSFANNTVNSSYPVALPALPTGISGTNVACLTASGNTSSGVLRSCPSSNDINGLGKLRLTAATTSQEGGVFAATSVPTSQGIDATFNTYQYGGTGADGIAFVLAAVNPADPLSPANMGESGGALGYSASAGSSLVGLADGYMGIGLDVHGNFSNSVYQGTGCTNPSYISTNNKQVPGQVVIRGPGNSLAGYCAINSTATTTSSPPLTLRALLRPLSVVPVEVTINPTAASFTTASGITVAAGTYKVVFTPVGGSATTLTGTLPTVPSGLYPSSSWTTSAGIPKQLAFGWVGSTGGLTDFHEVDLANVVSFTPTPQLAVTQTSYSATSPALGAPVTYTVNPSVSASGASETSSISVSETLPAGVTPTGAYGTGWTCATPVGQVITCTNSNTPFAAGSALAPITVEGIVTASGVTSSTIQSGSTVTASSSDGNPGIATSTTVGTLPTAPSGITLSSTSGTISGGNAVTISGSNISTATVIYIGTTSQQQAGTPIVLLPCTSGPAAGCFTVNANGTISISSMPAMSSATTVNVTVVTLGIAGVATYAYTDKPGTPTAPTASAGITSATVTWTAPASNNSPITSYIVTPYISGVAQTPVTFDASTTTRTLTGLTAGASYTFTVAAVNAIGTGAASPQSNAVVPYTLPGAPTIGAVTAGDSAATVTWTAPASNGGAAITGYVVTPYIVGVAQAPQTFNSAATTESVTGLTPGTSYTFKVAAINAAGTGPASAMSSAVTVNAGPSLTFAAPPAGEVSIGYSDALTAAGGTGALTWSVSAGSLPPGLSLNPGTGVLSGNPTAGGSYPFTVKVTDTAGGTATKGATVVIAAVPSLSNPPPPAAQAAVAYSDALTVAGGTGPFTWAVSSSNLPPGLSLSASTGVISGTPASAGLYTFAVRVKDSFGLTATQGLSISVATGPLVIAATANTSTATQGGVVGYTITITNTAATAYSGVTYTVPLSHVLDDAAYNGDAAATSGTVSFVSRNLTWTGSLAAGAAATVTFSVTVSNPYTGNGTLAFTLTSPTTGTNCPAGGTESRCTVSVPVSALTITQAASVPAAAPGTVVGYTVTVTNSGAVAYTGATFTDPLAGVLDDAAYNGNAAATSGSVSYASPNLTWAGSLAAGASATITFSVTINNPDTGNRVLTSTITSGTAGSNCPAGGTDPRCTATVNVMVLTITNTVNTVSATPGSTVQYTITVVNSGTASYTGASITDSLSGLLDDATYNGDATASAGSLSYTSPNLTWTGNLAAGATATITFTATVNNPDTGNRILATLITSAAAGSNCAAGSTSPSCATTVPVAVLTMTNVASTGTTTPGAVVRYTVTVANTGQVALSDITFSLPLAGVLDDASYGNDAGASAGLVSFTSPVLSWTGDLDPGQSATITFSVTVNNPDAGDKVLASTLTSATPGSTCPASGPAPAACTATVTVLVPALAITKTASSSTTTPGATLQYTITVANTGQTPYTPATVTDNLTSVLSDAAYNSDAAATAGTTSYTSPVLTWAGTLAPGGTATITYSVTVSNPETGPTTMTNTAASTAPGSSCPPATSASQCTATTTIIAGPLTITAPASANLGAAPPGATIQDNLGTIQVTDDRGFGASWTATASSTGFTTGGGTPAETIPVGNATYTITSLSSATGPATFTNVTTATLSGNPQAVVSATQVNGNTTATWNPMINVTVPAGAIGGAYTATITHSVS